MEPATTAKVILTTTKGEIEIAIWAKEIPLASRNFLQLCRNGYYDGVSFHRVVPNFVIQGGDPSGSGYGGWSIYPEGTFKDEFNQRLKFNRRGMVAMANTGKPNSNGSQFIITLAPTPELNRKNTVFGHVIGDTIFTVIEIADGTIDEEGKPLYPVKIVKTEVIEPYFTDLEEKPQDKSTKEEEKEIKITKNQKKSKKASINYDDEEEDSEISIPIRKIRPAHDLLDDRILKKRVIVEETNTKNSLKIKGEKNIKSNTTILASNNSNETVVPPETRSPETRSTGTRSTGPKNTEIFPTNETSTSKPFLKGASREKYTLSKVKEYTEMLTNQTPSWMNRDSDEEEHYSEED